LIRGLNDSKTSELTTPAGHELQSKETGLTP
jgi:hypothetical protein